MVVLPEPEGAEKMRILPDIFWNLRFYDLRFTIYLRSFGIFDLTILFLLMIQVSQVQSFFRSRFTGNSIKLISKLKKYSYIYHRKGLNFEWFCIRFYITSAPEGPLWKTLETLISDFFFSTTNFTNYTNSLRRWLRTPNAGRHIFVKFLI